MDFQTPFQRKKSPSIDFSSVDSLTEQHHLPDTDISLIVERALRTGVLGDPHTNYTFGQFADVSNVTSFASMQIHAAEARTAFEQMPAKLRYRFDNDPEKLLAFLDNPENKDEAIKLGLLKKPLEQPPEGVQSPESPAVGTGGSLDITVPTDTKNTLIQ